MSKATGGRPLVSKATGGTLVNPVEESPKDELEELTAEATADFRQASGDWVRFFELQRGTKSDLGNMASLQHPAAPLLESCKVQGVPVVMAAAPWSMERKKGALVRGPHKSAKEHRAFLREECASMIKKGHWVLLPAKPVMTEPELRLSPLGVVPQRERRPRTISDCSYFGVNDDTEERNKESQRYVKGKR